MEKLIELLNEYETLKVGAKPRKILSDGTMYCDSIYGLETLYGELICGKPYGFIKWLVDNDKIDREGMEGHGRLISYCLYIKSWEWDKIKEGVLLMLLAISDTPIDDLISYLK